jgi:hypothetical protein
MHFFSVIIPLLAVSTQAVEYGECSNGGDGICIETSLCAYYNGRAQSDLCPGTGSSSKYLPSEPFLF